LDLLVSFYYHLTNMAEADEGFTRTPHAFCIAFVVGTVRCCMASGKTIWKPGWDDDLTPIIIMMIMLIIID
jgi:hypothetical protein